MTPRTCFFTTRQGVNSRFTAMKDSSKRGLGDTLYDLLLLAEV